MGPIGQVHMPRWDGSKLRSITRLSFLEESMINAVISSKKPVPAAHGGGVRGDNSTPGSQLFEGRFGRMFRSLPPAEWPKEALVKLGDKMTADPEVDEKHPILPVLPAAAPEVGKRIHDDEE